MIALIKLLSAHLAGDFLLQPKSWVAEKEARKLRSPKLYLHILLHGVLSALFLWNSNYWPAVMLLMLFHGIIDVLKLYVQKESNKTAWFLADQILHLLSVFGVWLLFFKPGLNLAALQESESLWIYAAAILFITVVAGIVMQVMMANWSKSIATGQDDSLKNAGKYIGILERLFVFVFVVTGNWQGIGFLIAAKSVFRFGDLKEAKDRKLTEYILIGTLLSFAIAVACGMLAVWLTHIS